MPELFCLQCGYNLQGAESDACPECGKAFNPDTLPVEIQKQSITTGRLLWQILWPPLIVAVLFWALFWLSAIWNSGSVNLLFALVLPPLLLVILSALLMPSTARRLAIVRARRAENDGSSYLSGNFIKKAVILLCCAQFLLAFSIALGGCAVVTFVILSNVN